MAVKKWKIYGQLNHDAQKVVAVEVRANGRRKAEEKGEDMMKKKFKASFTSVIKVCQLDDDGNEIKEVI